MSVAILALRLTRPACLDPSDTGGNDVVWIAAADLFIGRVMPIDPVLAIVGPDADQSTYQQVYHQLGFDKSLAAQFGIYFTNLLHGDLGNALLTGKPVMDDIVRVFPATIELATMAIVVGAGLGIPLGCWRRHDAIACRITWCASLARQVIPHRFSGWG